MRSASNKRVHENRAQCLELHMHQQLHIAAMSEQLGHACPTIIMITTTTTMMMMMMQRLQGSGAYSCGGGGRRCKTARDINTLAAAAATFA